MALLFAGLGLLGGFARALFGLLKAVGRGERVKPWLFGITLVTSLAIGAALGLFMDVDYRLAAVAGYVGTDILESIVKTSMPGTITLEK